MTDRATLLGLDRAHVFRPFTPTDDQAHERSLVVVDAWGPFLVDADGRQFFDATGAWWCNHLGFRHPRIVEALAEQARTLPHVALAGATHEQAARLAAELVAVAPEGLRRVFFGDNGSTAVEIAAKLAFQYWQQNGRPERTRFLTLNDAYHGDTVGAMSLGGVDAFVSVFRPLLFTVDRAPTDRGLEAAVDWLVDALDRGGETVAAVVVEPRVLGAAGMRLYPEACLRALRQAADRADTFLVFDEVFTGFGRTGPMWAADSAGVAPDLLCTAKGLTAGTTPFSAVLCTDRIHEGFAGARSRSFQHGHTFCGHPIGARVAREVLAVYRDERVLEAGAATAARLAAGFARLGRLPGVRDARWLGCIGAAELGEPGYFGPVGWQVREAALRRGLSLRPLGNTVYFVPPLNCPAEALDDALEALYESVDEVLSAS